MFNLCTEDSDAFDVKGLKQLRPTSTTTQPVSSHIDSLDIKFI